jgi:hypothetical protein
MIGLVLCAVSCVNPEKLLSDNSRERVYFGKSGGFTNISEDYLLIEHSYVYNVEKDKITPIRKLTKNEIKKLDALINNVNLWQFNLNEPGNMTYYIRVSANGSEKEIKWADTSKDEKIKEIYKALVATLKE